MYLEDKTALKSVFWACCPKGPEIAAFQNDMRVWAWHAQRNEGRKRGTDLSVFLKARKKKGQLLRCKLSPDVWDLSLRLLPAVRF
jgi:hypothetical protein